MELIIALPTFSGVSEMFHSNMSEWTAVEPLVSLREAILILLSFALPGQSAARNMLPYCLMAGPMYCCLNSMRISGLMAFRADETSFISTFTASLKFMMSRPA